MPNEIPKHLRPTVTVTPTMREAARRAGIDVSRDDVDHAVRVLREIL